MLRLRTAALIVGAWFSIYATHAIADDRLSVFVIIVPPKYFVQQIA